ncbi:MAG: hypothetical protein AUH43_15715 [Acidobacteria bacterium 13_1_40CM_65_14]|nr:MAG: hypothetical protein AUH43_15715 [Acidobacteria bacterium 13_1_40CM_65_14]
MFSRLYKLHASDADARVASRARRSTAQVPPLTISRVSTVGPSEFSVHREAMIAYHEIVQHSVIPAGAHQH